MKTAETNTQTGSKKSSSSLISRSEEQPFFADQTKTANSFFSPAFVQPKLEIGPPDDKYEQEADAVADKVMRMPGNSVNEFGLSNIVQPIIQRQVPSPDAEPQVREGSAGDVVEAVISIPEVELFLTDMGNDFLNDVGYAWDESLLNKFGLIGGGLGIAGGLGLTIYAARNDPEALDLIFSPLSGTVVAPLDFDPFPEVLRSFALEVNFDRYDENQSARNFMVGLHFDVGRLLPPILGFGAVDKWAPIGAPPIQRKCKECEEEERLQAKPDIRLKANGKSVAGPALASQLQSSKGNSQSLPSKTQTELGNKMGADFSGVKVHTDSQAAQMNRQLGAKAFTYDRDIYFNEGQYSPHSSSGKHLLAHELTHVVQQNHNSMSHQVQRTIGDGHDLASPRFAGHPELENAYDPGEPDLQQGARGIHVRIIQQALIDSGQSLPVYGVDGILEDETKAAIESFQISQGFSGSNITGFIDEATMLSLDQYFLDYEPMAQIPQTVAPGSGTRTLTPDEINEIERLRTSEVTAPPGGTLPNFDPDKHGPDCYENEVKQRVLDVVDYRYNDAVANETARANPSNIHDWSFIENIADEAKQETDRVFGDYYSPVAHPAFQQGINLFDARERKETLYTTLGPSYENRRVNWRVQKIIQGEGVHPVDVDHGAVQSRSAETTILTRIKSQVVSAKRNELVLIDKWWPGFADPSTSTVYIQRLKATTDAGNRDFAWQMFQTMVHEYIHTLAHPHYRTYYQSLPETRGGKTYREGMTDYFAKIVLDDVNYSPSLRNSVEGSYHDSAITHTIPSYTGYAEAANAEAVVGLVGIRNAMAAFFDGQVNLIGGP